ncbi:MAG: CDP-diacylglycerol--glycerol-3-phosphate 3-phosphatidyltransferase [Clostridia bacterium]|nr:CDP-diacylglycerol--glycerol-3-phosphate 3-phosphatidyltransferase [Clostridia bacterium]
MNLPNKLSLIRCALTPVFMALMLMDFPFHYAAALVVFIVASLTDMWDGRIARKQGLITNLGKFLDPLADKALTTAAFICFVAQLQATSLAWALMLILTREFMVTSVRLLAAKDGVVVAASFAGKLKTVMQMVAIIYMIAAFQVCDLFVDNWALGIVLISIGILLVWISTIATVVSGIQYVWALRHYFKETTD